MLYKLISFIYIHFNFRFVVSLFFWWRNCMKVEIGIIYLHLLSCFQIVWWLMYYFRMCAFMKKPVQGFSVKHLSQCHNVIVNGRSENIIHAFIMHNFMTWIIVEDLLVELRDPKNRYDSGIRASISLSYITWTFNMGRPFWLMDA